HFFRRGHVLLQPLYLGQRDNHPEKGWCQLARPWRLAAQGVESRARPVCGARSAMKAVLYSGDGKLALADVPRPELRDRLVPKKYREELLALPAEEQVLLKVEAASICGSDLHILEGGHPSAPPVVLGHEYVARVVEVGSAVTHVREGNRVVVDPNI